MSRRAFIVVACVAVALPGCKSESPRDPEYRTVDQANQEEQQHRPAQPLERDPWTEPGQGPAGPARAGARTVLVLPAALEPIPPEERPELPAALRLGVACARDRALALDAADVILALEAELTAEPRVSAVVGLYEVEAGEVALERLARAAEAQGLHLLLVDLRVTGDAGREGLLLDARSGALLCRWERRGPSSATSASAPAGFLERLGEAYARAR